MIRLYYRLRAKNGLSFLVAAIIFSCSLFIFPSFPYIPTTEWFGEAAHKIFFSEFNGAILWIPLFSLFLIFHLRFFSPDIMVARFPTFLSFWKARLMTLVIDTAVYIGLVFCGYLLFCFVLDGSLNQLDVLFEAQNLLTQYLSLLLYSCCCAVLSTLLQRQSIGLLIPFFFTFIEYIVGKFFMVGFFLFLKGFVIHNTWADVGKTILIDLVLLAGLFVLYGCNGSHQDFLTKEKE